MKFILYFLGVCLIIALLQEEITWLVLLILFAVFVGFKIFEALYYRSNNFLSIRNGFQEYVKDCNDLNSHIEDLKQTYSGIKKTNYGEANLSDSSRFNYKRKYQRNAIKSEYIHDCSASVCKNAEMQPFKYLCKYFNIKSDESTLEEYENVLNNFSAAEEGKSLLGTQLNELKASLKGEIPFLIRKIGMKKFMKKLGFEDVDFKTVYFPTYTFRYISPGGNKTTSCDIMLDISNLNNFVEYLSEKIKFRKSAAGQRALMTSKLREHIKNRDNHSCKLCNISIEDEPHLLLEIDHIIPISKGGMSTEDNLQTLCWRCNRTKGSKVL